MAADAVTIGLRRDLVNEGRRWRTGALRACAVVAVVGLAVGAAGQATRPMTEAAVRTLAQQAERESKGDATELVLALDRRVREAWGDFESFPLSIVRNDRLVVDVMAPYMAYRRSLADGLRIARPIDQAIWIGTVTIAVTPERLNAPDVVSIVVSRDGRVTPPIRSTLRPMTFSNGAGDERTIHAGEVHFPTAAFTPGAAVVATLGFQEGERLVRPFSESELRTLR